MAGCLLFTAGKVCLKEFIVSEKVDNPRIGFLETEGNKQDS